MEAPRITKPGAPPISKDCPALCVASSTFPSKILDPTFSPLSPNPTPPREIPISKMSDQEKEPTPAELAAREAEEKQRKAAEEAEQAALPYKWTQTIRDVDVTIPVPGTLKGRDLDVSLKRDSIRVAVKGQEAIIEVCPSPCLRTDTAVPIPATCLVALVVALAISYYREN